MITHPIDTEALRRLADTAMVEPPWEDAGEWQTDGYDEYVVVSCEQDSDGEYDHVAEAANERLGAFIAAADPNTVRALLDALSAAEHRADEAEARIEAVQHLIDQADEMGEWAITCTRLQWAIDGSAPQPGV